MRSLIILTILGLVGCNSSSSPEKSVVAITNLSSNSGGSGAIIQHSSEHTIVLTNKHVCAVVQNGGLVHSEKGTAFVVAYVESERHDLCAIMVNQDLGPALKIASSSPEFFEDATTIGHPHLLPTIRTEGHFSKKSVISVVIGTRACTQDEMVDPSTALFCNLIGRLPLIKNYETITVSTLIQPGSSGSSVLDSNGEIAAVIFAGAGDLGFGHAVPYEFVANFVNYELPNLAAKYPNTVLQFSANNQERKEFNKKVQEVCGVSDILNEQQEKICHYYTDYIKSDMIYRK